MTLKTKVNTMLRNMASVCRKEGSPLSHVCFSVCLFAAIMVLAAFATSGAESGVPEAPASTTLRVAQWNIGHFSLGRKNHSTIAPDASEARAAEYRAKIDALNVDVLGVSEFDPVFDTAGTSTEEAVFAGFSSRVAGPKNGYQCNAVFSRFPCLRSEVVDFDQRYQKTYFIDAVYEIAGKEVHVVQTHLDWNANETATDARPTQIRQLIRHFRDVPYVILCGDFNVCGAGEYFTFLQAGWKLTNCGPETGCLDTHISADRRMPCRRFPLDNVIVKGFRVKDVALDDMDFALSDHRIVVATLEMKL